MSGPPPQPPELDFPYQTFPPHIPDCRDYTGRIDSDRKAFDGGSQSDVFRGTCTLDGRWVAIKVMRVAYFPGQNQDDAVRRQTREVEIYKRLQTIRHENILPFYGTTKDFSNIGAIVMPYMENRSVPFYIYHNPNANRNHLVRGFVRGLRHLHSFHLIHGDLKANNILVSAEGIAMIADYGRAYIDGETSCTNSTTHSALWTAPEMFTMESNDLKQVLTQSADVWSMAVTILEIYYGKKSLWGGRTSIMLKAMGAKLNPTLGKEENYTKVPDELWPLLRSCWNYTRAQRPSAETSYNFVKRVFSS